MISRLRGMRDITGSEAVKHENTIRSCVDVARLFGYQLHFAPIMENSDVFLRSLGDTSDMVSKETYTFLDREKHSITLRPEFTASIVRSLLKEKEIKTKLVSYGSLFRHERPQKGRFREFTQVNFENIGYNAVEDDLELLSMGSAIFTRLGVQSKLLINTLGEESDRKAYTEYLVHELSKYKHDLSEDSKVRLVKNPLRILDSKSSKDQEIVGSLKSFHDKLSYDAKNRFIALQRLLEEMGIEYTISDKLVRGLDYYTGVVFEYVTDKLSNEREIAIFAGGRYDKLFESMGGTPTQAIGGAIGIDRVTQLYNKKEETIDVYIISDSFQEVAKKLRENNISVLYEHHVTLKKGLERANRLGIKIVVIFQDHEQKENKAKVKNMTTGEQVEVDVVKLIEYIVQHIKSC